MVLNSELIIEFAEAFANRVARRVASRKTHLLVQEAYNLAFGRFPDEDETRAAVAFIQEQQSLHQDSTDNESAAALVDFCHALLNANEFIYVD